MIKFKSLNRNKDFLKILKKKRLNTKYFTIYFDKNLANFDKYLNISFVMKKKIGNAVIRNRIKRLGYVNDGGGSPRWRDRKGLGVPEASTL